MEWLHPYMFALAPVFLILALIIPKKQEQYTLLADASQLEGFSPGLKVEIRNYLLFALLSIGIISLSIAAARPVTKEYVYQPQERRNIMLAIDISRSMGAQDFFLGRRAMRRIDAVKSVIAEFVNNRSHDRMGLVIFGSKAFLEAPLTIDHPLLIRFVEQLEIGLAGMGTALGDGLGIAIKHVENIESSAKTIILLTDGVQSSGNVSVLEAADIAKELGVKVHTIGIGSKRSKTNGFDVKTLEEIARKTGGQYFSPATLEELQAVYQVIDDIETSKEQEEPIELVYDHFENFALTGFISLALYLALSVSIFKVLP